MLPEIEAEIDNVTVGPEYQAALDRFDKEKGVKPKAKKKVTPKKITPKKVVPKKPTIIPAPKPKAKPKPTPTANTGSNRTIKGPRFSKDTPKAVQASGRATSRKNLLEKMSIGDYTDHGYKPINKALRKGRTPSGKLPKRGGIDFGIKRSDQLKTLDKATGKKLSEPVTVYRGVGSTGQSQLDNARKALKEGGTVSDKGFMSTSVNPAAAVEGFAEPPPVLLQIQTDKGAYLEPVSRVKGEMEMLLPRKSEFRILGVDEKVKIDGLDDGEIDTFTVIRMERI
jgi:hypothetical protein